MEVPGLKLGRGLLDVVEGSLGDGAMGVSTPGKLLLSRNWGYLTKEVGG